MFSKLVSFSLIIIFIDSGFGNKTESNILRLGRLRKPPSAARDKSTLNFNGTNKSSELVTQSQSRDRLSSFSKNNPELDWRNYLKNVVKNEESLRDLDLNFMKENPEMSANSAQWLNDLYDPLRWVRIPGKLQDDCRRDMELFLKALRDGKLWAAKHRVLADASDCECGADEDNVKHLILECPEYEPQKQSINEFFRNNIDEWPSVARLLVSSKEAFAAFFNFCGECLWLKMFDASGRYSSQFHFGNSFWLGSSSLCRELNSTGFDGIDGIAGVDAVPYPVKFYVARLGLNFPSDVEPSTRQVFLGLCLPVTCDRTSLSSLLRASADRVEKEGNGTHHSTGPRITIVTLKPVPSSDYSALDDPKVYILGSVTGAILLLMLFATAYEYQQLKPELDIESTSHGTNDNERGSSLVDRNWIENHRISMIHGNGKELIENIERDTLQRRTEPSLQKFDKKKGFWIKCLLAFSPIINGAKIASTEHAARESLTCLHGLRVFSLGWVVMVHTYLQVFSIAENKTLRTVTERNFMYQTISNATFSVDTFFFISGLLVTILFYRSTGPIRNDSNNFLKTSCSKFLVMILYRFIRLTPAYLFVLGMNEVAIKHAQARTVFSPAIIDHLTCEKFWWRNALYVNSLYPRTEMCMLWSWYMANDTQFYVLGIFLLLFSIKYLKVVAVTVFLLIISSWFTTFSIAYSNDYLARIQEPFALFDELYDKPWLRAGPYFVGAITGWVLFRTNCEVQTPLWGKIIGWLFSGGTMSAVVYGLYPGDLGVTTSSVYAALSHTAWAIAVAFIVVQCCSGSAAFVNKILSLRLIFPLSRLTYCAYLVHPIIMMITSMQMDGPLHLHNGLVLILYFGNLVASYLLSFCVSITLEAPIVNLLKIAFSPNERRR